MVQSVKIFLIRDRKCQEKIFRVQYTSSSNIGDAQVSIFQITLIFYTLLYSSLKIDTVEYQYK